ncbi:SDR family oxidoreductase [Salmonella enterica]|uniref:Oxidoreductase UcpA n=3 Tax=Salmonella enterica TaxID=28901 RepID=A0A749S6U7_SALER|nr:oxidoreductase [Salmonella enterica subsp. enterica serovar Koketime]EAB8207412.1 SDR family NAD(P)-dependent oxidoreductase [Salmonella enterica subsp. enterica serovar Lattenkamp]EAM8931794.1 SDR family oxidoreductase [Salmonella enterica]EBY0371926.1 SDR family NAD(P)-dependent oxidoreductase [Salmonella enterica subsp. enterica serovar Toulon]ECG8591228.1 SDR family oxidoreductase [Salmonella enterica subsp. salamae]ECJ3922991.1 SDR family oxidoreductase [Salmonella enterica subsp. ente
MNNQANTRVVIVTGASQGIGHAIAQVFLKNGDIVVGCAFSAPEKAIQANQLRESYPEHFFYYQVDVSDTAQIKAFVTEVEQQFGRIDVVVSNAGKNVFKGIDCEESDWEHNFNLNLRSHWYLAKCARQMLQKSHGVLLLMTSNHAFSTMPGCAPYNISKRALLSLVQSLTIEWGPEIRTVGIAPGFIDTNGNQAWFDSHPDARIAREKTIKKHPVGRIGRPEEVGELCLFLASDKAGFIAGTTILIDGGRSAIMQDEEA